MATTVRLYYYLNEYGQEVEADDGTRLLVFSDGNLEESEITTDKSVYLLAIEEALYLMDVLWEDIVQIEPKYYRVYPKKGCDYHAVWARIVTKEELSST